MDRINRACLSENYAIPFWETQIAFQNSFVISANADVFGYILCDNQGNINSFALLDKFRKRGYGRQLLETCLHHVISQEIVSQVSEVSKISKVSKVSKVSKISLQVRTDNTVAQRLYEKVGFEKIKLLPKYYQNEIDGFLYELDFTKCVDT